NLASPPLALPCLPFASCHCIPLDPLSFPTRRSSDLRVSVIPYYPLTSEDLLEIVGMRLNAIQQRLKERYGAQCHIDAAVLERIVLRCQNSETGARTIESILNQTLLPELATECLTQLACGSPIRHVHISLNESGGFHYQLQ